MMKCKPYLEKGNYPNSALKNENRVTFSALKDAAVENYIAPTYSIKYALRGTEYYNISKRRFAVSAGHFLLVNKEQAVDFSTRSQKKVLGFCIHLKPDLLNEVYTDRHLQAASLIDDPFQRAPFTEFEPLIYSEQENALGQYIHYMWQHFDPQELVIALDRDEVFYELTHRLMGIQHSVSNKDNQLTVQKSTTRNELLRRLKLAKEMIDAQSNISIDIETIAREAMLSGSHFFRSFKKVYGVSPYQYLLKKRLNHAAHLLTSKRTLVKDIALECGFPDTASFSKAFKKTYQLSPNQFQKAI